MPNLNSEAKLITPGQALFFVILGAFFYCWYYDVNVGEQFQAFREAIHALTGGVL